jgi:3',5'-cyclic AMP phosphodiesterase CpdA
MLIAQITDTHVTTPEIAVETGIDALGALRRCVEHLGALSPRPDLLLVTGDLVDRGDVESYRLFQKALAPLGLPMLAIPGNHDSREAMREAFAGHAGIGADGPFLNIAGETGGLRLIGLDTTIPGRIEGLLCDERLDWLDARLSEAPQQPALLFMHHPPFETGLTRMDGWRCGNADGLARILVRHRQVVHVLCGHVHRAIDTTFAGIPASIGPSPSHAVGLNLDQGAELTVGIEPPLVRLLYWTGKRLISHLSPIDGVQRRVS